MYSGNLTGYEILVRYTRVPHWAQTVEIPCYLDKFNLSVLLLVLGLGLVSSSIRSVEIMTYVHF